MTAPFCSMLCCLLTAALVPQPGDVESQLRLQCLILAELHFHQLHAVARDVPPAHTWMSEDSCQFKVHCLADWISTSSPNLDEPTRWTGRTNSTSFAMALSLTFCTIFTHRHELGHSARSQKPR